MAGPPGQSLLAVAFLTEEACCCRAAFGLVCFQHGSGKPAGSLQVSLAGAASRRLGLM